MVELELIGLHSDGEHLTLAGPDGQRYQLLLDDALRAAVRRDRPQLEQIRAGQGLRPREIQARIRAGATAQEVAEAAGLPIAHVQRYEGPVLAERAWVIDQARRFTVRRAEDSPQLGDLVVDRLATRGVRAPQIEWDAVRPADSPWELVCRFHAGEKQRTARWEIDMGARTTRATDDEARWLSETDVAPAGPVARRHLAAVRLYDVEADGDLGPALAAVDADLSGAAAGDDDHAGDDGSFEELGFGDLPAASTDDLLAELRATRGTRARLEGEEDEDDWGLPPAAHPPASRPHEAFDAQVLPLPRGEQDAAGGPDTGPAQADAAPAADRSTRRATAPETDDAESADTAATQATASGTEAAAGTGQKRRRASDSSSGSSSAAAKRRSRRPSVPSWDEIVFGARPD